MTKTTTKRKPRRPSRKQREYAAYTELFQSAQVIYDACYELNRDYTLPSALVKKLDSLTYIVRWARLKTTEKVAAKVEREVSKNFYGIYVTPTGK